MKIDFQPKNDIIELKIRFDPLLDLAEGQEPFSFVTHVTSASKHRFKETEEGQEIMCEIMEKINDETRDEINALIIRLIEENRLEDLRRAATDIAFQTQLLRELFPQKYTDAQ